MDRNQARAQGFVQFTFDLPPLPALTELSLRLPFKQDFELPPNSRLFPTLTASEFPVLRKLWLQNYREDYGLLGLNSLPSVECLHLSYQEAPLTDRFWLDAFTNLSYLGIEVVCRDSAEGNVSFVLTHFPRLIHLKLDFIFDGCGVQPDYWNVLTGSAPRPVTTHALLNWDFTEQAGELPEPIDGIYQVSTFQNLRGKNNKTSLFMFAMCMFLPIYSHIIRTC